MEADCGHCSRLGGEAKGPHAPLFCPWSLPAALRVTGRGLGASSSRASPQGEAFSREAAAHSHPSRHPTVPTHHRDQGLPRTERLRPPPTGRPASGSPAWPRCLGQTCHLGLQTAQRAPRQASAQTGASPCSFLRGQSQRPGQRSSSAPRPGRPRDAQPLGAPRTLSDAGRTLRNICRDLDDVGSGNMSI